MKKKIVLKPGREKSLHKKHPWIFSGAIQTLPKIQNGDILPIYSSQGEFLAHGYFHTSNSIAGRVLTFADEPIKEALSNKLDQAFAYRKAWFADGKTNCYRLINAEADGIPGLIVDKYDQLIVIQINTCGMEKLKPLLLELIVEKLSPKAVYEKSISSARKQEGLNGSEGWIYQQADPELVVSENGVLFHVNVATGQKTGFFLDQRNMRKRIGELSRGKRVLNCFCYSGGFSIYALLGGAEKVTSVDCNADALRLAEKNNGINQIDPSRHQIVNADVFDFLRTTSDTYDLIIFDPPAFAKKKGDQNRACAGYKEINRLGFELLKRSDAELPLQLTCSCSYFIDEQLFQNVVFQAALDAKCNAQLLMKHLQAEDHPISLAFPEGNYLKSLLLRALF